jgi:addiction module HigA family antidote
MPRMHNPPHPGEVIKELCVDPLGLTVTAAAEGLGVSRRTLSTLLNGHAGISPDMAIVEGVRPVCGKLAAPATPI